MYFPIQRIQTDRGTGFFAIKVQKYLLSQSMRFRPINPESPYLSDKVEGSQKTDLSKFYPTIDFTDPDLNMRIKEWQFFYNWYRLHGSLKGQTPMEKLCGLLDKTPYWADVYKAYDPGKIDI